MNKVYKKVYKMVLSGILLSLSIVISTVENMLPLPLGVKPGFSNLSVMIAMSELGILQAFSIMLLKSVFVMFTRGTTAFILSICGGLLSFLIMLVIFRKTNASFLMISISGSLAHNIGQICVSCIIMKTITIALYLPILIIFGCIAGIVTGITAQLIIPKIKLFLRRTK